jgi:hypothetical protein
MDDATQAFIQARCTERYLAQRTKDYARADFIRDKLAEDYAVVLDDRTREWTIASGDGEQQATTSSDANHRFVQAATASQRSAFVRTTEPPSSPSSQDQPRNGNPEDDDDTNASADAALAEILDHARPDVAPIRVASR